jgi:hypothetical protein
MAEDEKLGVLDAVALASSASHPVSRTKIR